MTLKGKIELIYCESVFRFTGNNIDCPNALEIKEKLYNLIKWMCTDKIPFLKI